MYGKLNFPAQLNFHSTRSQPWVPWLQVEQPPFVSMEIPLLLGAFATLLFSWCLYSLYLHPLAQYPGPLFARIGFVPWSTVSCLRGTTLQDICNAHERYGTWVRVGYNTLSTTEAAAVPVLYGTKERWRKTSFYLPFNQPGAAHNLFSTSGVDEHKWHRRINSRSYSMANIIKLQDAVREVISSLIKGLSYDLSASSENHLELDLGKYLTHLAGDVVGTLTFGDTSGLGLLNDLHDQEGIAKATEATNRVSAIVGSLGLVGSAIWKLLGLFVESTSIQRKLIQKAKVAIENREERQTSPKGLLHVEDSIVGTLSLTKDPKTGELLRRHHISHAALIPVFAGLDTTSTTMRAFFMLTMTTDGVWDKLLSEIRSASQEGALSQPPLYEETRRLSYFQSCLMETLRIWPAVSYIMPRQAPKGGVVIATKYIPEGTIVGMSAPAFHRTSSVFGSVPEVFRPNRWLDESVARRSAMESNLLSFGYGAHTCIGKNISMLEISLAIPSFLQRFEFELLPRSATSPHTSKRANSYGMGSERHTWNVTCDWFAVQHNLWVKIKAREDLDTSRHSERPATE